MTVLIVHESMFGNTREVAEAIAEGMTRQLGRTPGPGAPVAVEVRDVADAPDEIPDTVTLLLVGGPTHAFSMTRESTREDAARQGASGATETGIREWIEKVAPRAGLPVITFDTRVHVRFLPGSAAKTAASALQHRGFRHAERGESFWVGGTSGPLSHDELVRARAWGGALAERFVTAAPM